MKLSNRYEKVDIFKNIKKFRIPEFLNWFLNQDRKVDLIVKEVISREMSKSVLLHLYPLITFNNNGKHFVSKSVKKFFAAAKLNSVFYFIK